jgi:3-hydroxyacyl-CoA dehydrogenase
MKSLEGCTLAIIGAGTMGAGIAQVAAQCGHRVLLLDSRDGAALEAKSRLAATLDGLVARQADAATASAALSRIEPVCSYELAPAGRRGHRREPRHQAEFADLERIVGGDTIRHQRVVDLGDRDRARYRARAPGPCISSTRPRA